MNSDPEMLPRLRLHPVPYAMQATSAQTALTANNLVEGGGVPNAVSFGAGGAKQISFPDGGLIIDSATGMTLRGGGANKTVTIDGDWSAGAILDRGDSNGNPNVRSTYPVSINRYVVEAPDNGASPDTVPVDGALLNQLCQDQDGCKVSLYMRDAVASRQPGQLAGITSYHLSLSPALNSKQEWDMRDPTGDGNGGTDKDGVTQHLLNIYNDCFFTDGEYVNGSNQNDNALGFGLLNWNTTYTYTGMTCVLMIED